MLEGSSRSSPRFVPDRDPPRSLNQLRRRVHGTAATIRRAVFRGLSLGTWCGDLVRETYSARRQDVADVGFERYLMLPDPHLLSTRAEALLGVAENHLAHRFDLLGSGWIEVRPGMTCRGLEGHTYPATSITRHSPSRLNPANRRRSRRIFGLVDPGYQPIDWQIDFKSGYRWSERTWYRHISYGALPGVDVKVPWELARMQHLPQLAMAYAIARTRGHASHGADEYYREFRNQTLDFVASNPPRFGVNWASTMDVAIRIANLIVAYDLFRAQGVTFDLDFEDVLKSSAFDHALFIVNNLEWNTAFRSNHYLADIAGLLVVAAFLPQSELVDAWLAFAIGELLAETMLQFDEQGANFEGSTSYHRLSGETVVYATAVACGISDERWASLSRINTSSIRRRYRISRRDELPDPKTRFPDEHWKRLHGMGTFVTLLTKSDGQMPQVGDNDNGRFLKLSATYEHLSVPDARDRLANLDGFYDLPDDHDYWLEQHLDHRHLVGALNGFFDDGSWSRFANGYGFETELISALAGKIAIKHRVRPRRHPVPLPLAVGDRPELTTVGYDLTRWRFEPGGDDLTVGVRAYEWPFFGLYLLCSERLHVLLRCGPVGQLGNGGHSHNDQLALTLCLDGEDWIVDHGTYLYTPLPVVRNAYRSVQAHFAPRRGAEEPNPLDRGLFALPDRTRAKCLFFDPSGFVGHHEGFGSRSFRSLTISADVIEVVDATPARDQDARERIFEVHSSTEARELSGDLPVSPGYGLRYRKGFR